MKWIDANKELPATYELLVCSEEPCVDTGDIGFEASDDVAGAWLDPEDGEPVFRMVFLEKDRQGNTRWRHTDGYIAPCPVSHWMALPEFPISPNT